QTGDSDEGRAMLELIHDVAPKAGLAFSSGDVSQLNFAHNIINLADAGANVIVDDLLYPDEPFFQDGVVAQAVGTATHQYGIPYFNAAGNNAGNGFGQKTHWVTDANGRTVLDFDPSGLVDTRMEMTMGLPNLLFMQ